MASWLWLCGSYIRHLKIYFACLHQEDGLDADGDKNPEEHSAGAAVVGDRKSFEQVFSKNESIWV